MNSSLEQKITIIDKIANDIPAVIVIHELSLNGPRVIYISPTGLKILKTSKEEVAGLDTEEFHNRYFNPDDAADYHPKILELLERKDDKEMITFFQQVRSSNKEDFKWYLTTSKIFMKDSMGYPTHIIAFAHPIDPQHHLTSKVSRLLEENNFLRKNHKIFAELTKREKEILKLMALGENTPEISVKLFISETTVNTHRRNIRSKLNIDSNYDIVRFAQAFDLI